MPVPPRIVFPHIHQETHHIDGDPRNNELGNLRAVSREEPSLTVAEAASHLSVGYTTVRRWILSGTLGVTAESARGAYRIPECEIVRMLEEQERKKRWIPRSVGR